MPPRPPPRPAAPPAPRARPVLGPPSTTSSPATSLKPRPRAMLAPTPEIPSPPTRAPTAEARPHRALWNLTVAPATLTCTSPATGGSSTTFDVGVANTYGLSCYETTGVSGIATYPSSITVNTGALPADATEATTTGNGCTQSTSGSGTSEHYILTCTSPKPRRPVMSAPTRPHLHRHGRRTGAAATPGTLEPDRPPWHGRTAPAPGDVDHVHQRNRVSYSVACYGTGLPTATYPTSITVNTGSLPADAAFPTTTGRAAPRARREAGSATEQYILTCKITETPTAADDGTYPLTFPATGGGGAPTITSGTLTLKVAQVAPTWVTGQVLLRHQGRPVLRQRGHFERPWHSRSPPSPRGRHRRDSPATRSRT